MSYLNGKAADLQRVAKDVVNKIQLVVLRLSLSRSLRAEIWQLMADLTASGLSDAEAFETVATIYQQRRRRSIAHVMLELRAAISRKDFPDTAKLYVSDGEALLFSGYTGSNVVRMFGGAARVSRAELLIARAIRTAVAGPALLFAVLSGVLWLAGTQVFAVFGEIAPIETWPRFAQIYGSFCMWFASHGFLLAIALIVVIAGFKWLTNNWTVFGRTWADNLPPFSFYKMRVGASFLFAVVEGARMGETPNEEFLRSMAKGGSKYTASRINAIADYVGTAPSLGAATLAADQNFPAKDLNTILNALMAKDDWEEKLAKFTDRWLEDVERRAKATAAILNFTLLLLVTFAAVGLLLSIFTFTQTLSN
jgi:type II secretory pathway component PulF